MTNVKINPNISERQKEILKLLMEKSHRQNELQDALGISSPTLIYHLKKLEKKLLIRKELIQQIGNVKINEISVNPLYLEQIRNYIGLSRKQYTVITGKLIKKFWNEFKKQWLWVNIGAYMMITMINWTGFFLGSIKFEMAFLITFIYPLIILSIFYIRKSKFETTIYKIVWIVGGGMFLGFPIWVILFFVLTGAPWAPLHEANDILRGSISILILVPAYGVAAYLMYRLGKRRDFRPFM